MTTIPKKMFKEFELLDLHLASSDAMFLNQEMAVKRSSQPS